jgi:hypothetical protein
MASESEDIHRIGGGKIDNLRLKQREMKLHPPGISVLKASTPGDAARQMKEAFPQAESLRKQSQVVGTTSAEKIKSIGFDLIAKPTRMLPNHYRIIHPEGLAGFNNENLRKLSEIFTDSHGHEL